MGTSALDVQEIQQVIVIAKYTQKYVNCSAEHWLVHLDKSCCQIRVEEKINTFIKKISEDIKVIYLIKQ